MFVIIIANNGGISLVKFRNTEAEAKKCATEMLLSCFDPDTESKKKIADAIHDFIEDRKFRKNGNLNDFFEWLSKQDFCEKTTNTFILRTEDDDFIEIGIYDSEKEGKTF